MLSGKKTVANRLVVERAAIHPFKGKYPRRTKRVAVGKDSDQKEKGPRKG